MTHYKSECTSTASALPSQRFSSLLIYEKVNVFSESSCALQYFSNFLHGVKPADSKSDPDPYEPYAAAYVSSAS